MSFRQYGGINYASRNNIVKNNYTNANNLSVMAKVGQPSSIINVDSGLYGLAGDITFKQLSEPFYGIVFSDNTKQTTAITTTDSFWQPYDSAPTPIIYYTNRVLIGADPSQISGTINASTKLAVNGNIAANGNLYAAYVSSGTGFNTFSVIGASGNTSISGTLGVSGATNLTSTLGVSGATNLTSTLGVSGATNLTSTLGVNGATNLSSTLGVSGATNLTSTLGVSGATNLTSTLGVSGATNLSSTLGVSGATNLNNGLQVKGTANPFTSLGADSINRLSHIPDAGSGSINYITVAGDNMLYLGGNSSGAPSNSVITNWSSVCSGLRWNGNTSLYLGMGGFSNIPSNNITFNAALTNSVAISTNGATRMTIDSGGNVGIGTTTPTSKLDIVGTLGVSGATNLSSTLGVSGATNLSNQLTVSSTSTTNYQGGFIYNNVISEGTLLSSNGNITEIKMNNFGSSHFTISNNDNSFNINDTSNNESPYTLGSNLMCIKHNTAGGTGNVGIGTTTPTSKLSVTNTNIAINSLYLTSGTLGTSLGDRSLISSYYTNVGVNGTYIDTYAYRYASGTSWDTTASTIIQSKIDTTPKAMIEFNSQGYPGGIAITNSGRIGIHIDTNGIPSAPTATAGTNNTQIATTAFVTTAVASGGGGSQTTLAQVGGYNTATGLAFPTTVNVSVPANAVYADVFLAGVGGEAGFGGDRSAGGYYTGGSGGGACASFGRIFCKGLQLTITNTGLDVSLSINGVVVITVASGNTGGGASPSAGGIAGTANTTAPTITATGYASWFSYTGTAGANGGTNSTPSTVGKIDKTGYNASTLLGCGQSISTSGGGNAYASQTTYFGGAYITYFTL